MWVNAHTTDADLTVMGGLTERRDGAAHHADALVERAANAVLRLGEERSPWTVADALLFVLETESTAESVAAEVAALLAQLPVPGLSAEAIVASVRAAQVDFGRGGRGAAQLTSVAEVAEMLPDLDAERCAVALDLLRRGGEAADLAVLLVPSSDGAASTSRSVDGVEPVATSIVAAHLSGQLDALADALPRATRHAFGSACERADASTDTGLAFPEPDLASQRLLWDDEAVAEWLDTPPEGYETLYRAVLARPAVRAFLDVLVDHPGRRMSGEEICSEAADDTLRTPNDLSGALNGMRAAVRSTGRGAPFRSWPGRPIRHGIHPTVALGFVTARRRLLGAAATA